MDEKVLKILACPKCKGDLTLKDNNLICQNCQVAYPIEDDIPILLEEEAKSLKEDDRKD